MLMKLLFALPLVAAQQPAPNQVSATAHKRDLSGVRHYYAMGASRPVAPDGPIPRVTLWAPARFDADRPG